MTKKLNVTIHEGTLRPALLSELEAVRCPGQQISSYYLDVDFQRLGGGEAARIALKDALDEVWRRIDQAGDGFNRHTLRRDWEAVQALASELMALRRPRGLACFVGSAAEYGRVFPLPWPVRTRCFFEERFVLWPLEQVLDQCERYCACLTDKDEARVFLYYLGQVEELATLLDEVPGKVRFPDPFSELEYQRKHVEAFHRHFRRVADTLSRFYRREPFEHLIIGGHPETLPQFENHLHRCLQGRVVARWHLPVRSTIEDIRAHAQAEEQAVLYRQACGLWQTIQEAGPQRTALGPEEVFAMLWQRRVHSILVDSGQAEPGRRCSRCGRLTLQEGDCPECGGPLVPVLDVFTEAVREAIEQSAHVRLWSEQVLLTKAGGMAALARY
jgi:peptide subunit release factor 1 (eRF1)